MSQASWRSCEFQAPCCRCVPSRASQACQAKPSQEVVITGHWAEPSPKRPSTSSRLHPVITWDPGSHCWGAHAQGCFAGRFGGFHGIRVPQCAPRLGRSWQLAFP